MNRHPECVTNLVRIAVIAQVWVVCATFVLQRFNGGCKVYFTDEKLFLLNLV